ncbi:MAG: hypothetical protein P4L69_11225 [Desulfosporosinus sp.]|nr:hypothetical protein [Desulfosporosinus sp.]
MGCAQAAASGGSCASGAAASGLSATATPVSVRLGFTDGLALSSAIGGAASSLTGGTFSQGAMNGAYGYLYNATLQFGATAAATFGPWSVNISGGIAVDDKGNLGLYQAGGFGPAAGGNATLGANLAVSNGQTIYDLEGPFMNYSANAALGPNVGVDSFTGPSDHGEVTGGGLSVGVGGGFGGSMSVTDTKIIPLLVTPLK